MERRINRSTLMLASFLTLVACGMAFVTRGSMGGIWEREFNIGSQDFGSILGAAFFGFGLVIFFGGLVTEKLGYKPVLIIAFLLHLASTVMVYLARPLYHSLAANPAEATSQTVTLLWYSFFLFSIGHGLYEAVINPLIGQLYSENQTHFLNVLHASWPAGMIIGGLISWAFIGVNNPAKIYQFALWEIPLTSYVIVVLWYGAFVLKSDFPPTVASKISNFGRLFSCFASPVFLLLLLLHGCIGYVEIGIDSWVTKLMANFLTNPVLLIVYTSTLMFVLRFFAGPIAHRINPIGLLFVSSVLAAAGLFWLGTDLGSLGLILLAATVYSLGKAFFWPTMLSVAGERYPHCGAVAMGALGAMGMITAGYLANPAIGYKQAINTSAKLSLDAPDTFARYVEAQPKKFLFFPPYRELTPMLANAANSSRQEGGRVDPASYNALKDELGKTQSAENKALVEKVDTCLANLDRDVPHVVAATKFGALRSITLTAYVPVAMAIGYLLLLIYFAMIGGYKKVELTDEAP
jgi:MFS family permease